MVLLVVRSLRHSHLTHRGMARCLVLLGRAVVRGSGSSRILVGSLRLVRGTMADKLHPAEAAAREEYAAGLEEQANVAGLEPVVARAIRGRARAIRQAMPILDFKRAMMAHDVALASGPSSGLEATEHHTGIREAQVRLKQDHPYPPNLERAVDAALKRGTSPDDIDLYEVTGIPNPDAVKGRPVRGALSKAQIQALADRVTAEVDAKLADLRKEIAEFKEQQTRLGARFPR
jgi:hypothetical protein